MLYTIWAHILGKSQINVTIVTRHFLGYTTEEDSMTNISGISEDSQGDKDYVQPPSVQEKIWHSIAYSEQVQQKICIFIDFF